MVTHAPAAPRPRDQRGFTLLELIIVIAMIGILATIAMPTLKDMPTRAKEAVLKTNLHSIRESIDMFYGDKGHYPASLDELVESKYLRQVPFDPFTKSSETWVVVLEDESEEEEPGPPPLPGEEENGPGVIDVHSSSNRKALDGTVYSSW
jgi:general secretion pathway protein G